jgi:uncharacterized protein (TIGR03067 family)
MWKNLWPLVALVAMLTAAVALADNSSPERLAPEKALTVLADSEQIQGTWVVAAMEANGEKSRIFFASGKVKFTLQGGRYFNPDDPDRRVGQYVLDEGQWPHRATLSWIEDNRIFAGPGGPPFIQQKHVILYDLNGDTLKVCMAGKDEPWPTQFISKGSQAIWILRREKTPEPLQEKKKK